jgi:hypothetical protein
MSEDLAESIDLCSESKLYWDGATLKLCLPEKQKTSYTMSVLEIYTFGVKSYRQFQ